MRYEDASGPVEPMGPTRRATLVGLGAVTALVLTGCTQTPEGTRPTTPGATSGGADPRDPGPLTGTPSTTSAPVTPLVVETVFRHTTLDPARQFDASGALLSGALYQTLTVLGGDDGATPEPGLADYTISPEGLVLTIRLRKGLTFADGAPITTDDVIFTFDRVRSMNGDIAKILGSVFTTRVDERTMAIAVPTANFALPAILSNPSLGIVNHKAVTAKGRGLLPEDLGSTWLDTHSAGSGPYVVSASDHGSVTLSANPTWEGSAVAFPTILVRSSPADQQAAHLVAGTSDIALDVAPDVALDLVSDAVLGSGTSTPSGAPAPSGTSRSGGTTSAAPIPATTTASAAPGATGESTGEATDQPTDEPASPRFSSVPELASTTAYLAMTRKQLTSPTVANPHVEKAIRLALDRTALAAVGGPGAKPAPGLIPHGLTGALTTAPPAPDLAAARAELVLAGYKAEKIPLSYAAETPIMGVPTGLVAAAIRDQLATAGLNIVLTPMTAAAFGLAHRQGQLAFTLQTWTADFPDPDNYLVFSPGGLLGLRYGWYTTEAPVAAELTRVARTTYGDDRVGAYQRWQESLEEDSPFIPLFQPVGHVLHGPRVTSLTTGRTIPVLLGTLQ